VAADGRRVKLVAKAAFACGRRALGEQLLSVRGRVGDDGRLALRAATRNYRYVFAGGRPHGRAAVRLRFDGPMASGTIRFTTHPRGRRCSVRLPVQLRAAAAPDPSPPAAPAGDGFYYGSSAARFRGVRTPVALHVRPDATAVDLTLIGAPLACRGARTRPYTDYLDDLAPPTRIRPDGTFSRRERFVLDPKGDRPVTVVRLRGRFTATGARGTYSVTQRSEKPRLRCRTRRIAWTAIR
jgi:hypothetical protein